MTERMKTKTKNAGTFIINIVDRKNATWQGSVSWVEGKQEMRFRSALELLKLMDSALDDQEIGGEDHER